MKIVIDKGYDAKEIERLTFSVVDRVPYAPPILSWRTEGSLVQLEDGRYALVVQSVWEMLTSWLYEYSVHDPKDLADEFPEFMPFFVGRAMFMMDFTNQIHPVLRLFLDKFEAYEPKALVDGERMEVLVGGYAKHVVDKWKEWREG